MRQYFQSLNKQAYLIDFTLKTLARQKSKAIGLLIVYTILVLSLASVLLFTHALEQEATKILAHAPEIVLQKMVAGRHSLIPQQYINKIGKLRGVNKIEPRLWGYFYDPVVQANYTFMADNNKEITNNNIIIGPAMARARGLTVDSMISWRGASGTLSTFTVQEILPQSTELMSADLVLLSPTDFQKFFNYPAGHFTDITITVNNPQEVRKIAEKLATALPDSRPILREEILRTYSALFNWRNGVLLAMLSCAILAFSILAWTKASGLSANEKREIGILKAIGWESDDILQMKFWEGVIISSIAFALGYLLAYVQVFYFNGLLFRPILQGWSVLYPTFTLPSEISVLQIFILFFLTVIPYTSAVVVPSWMAAIVDPDTLIR